MTEIPPLEALFDTHIITVPMSTGIQPTEIVESRGVDYESVPFPSADRLPYACRGRIARKFASVGEDLAEDGFYFVQDQNFAGSLNDLEWLRQQVGVGHSIRQTSQIRANDSRLRVPA